MSIDGKGSSLSRAAQDRISALSSANQRLMAANKHAEAFVREQAERYAAELSEALDERDRARRWAVELEQQIDACRASLADLAHLMHRHSGEVDASPIVSEASRKVVYGQAQGVQSALAAFLAQTVSAADEDADPTDMARAYAEGRDPLKETS